MITSVVSATNPFIFGQGYSADDVGSIAFILGLNPCGEWNGDPKSVEEPYRNNMYTYLNQFDDDNKILQIRVKGE